jgi:hypothetical protein
MCLIPADREIGGGANKARIGSSSAEELDHDEGPLVAQRRYEYPYIYPWIAMERRDEERRTYSFDLFATFAMFDGWLSGYEIGRERYVVDYMT